MAPVITTKCLGPLQSAVLTVRPSLVSRRIAGKAVPGGSTSGKAAEAWRRALDSISVADVSVSRERMLQIPCQGPGGACGDSR